MEKLKAIIELMRVPNCVMIGIAVIIGELFALHGSAPSSYHAIFGFLTGFLIQGAADASNDYFDRHIDAINAPHRPIPRGAISPEEALIFSAILSALGLLFSALLGLYSFLFALLFWTLAIMYNFKLKKYGLLGNAVVSACVAAPFLYGGIAVGVGVTHLLMIFALLAFFANLGREVNKGIVDVEGDKAKGIKTVAISLGEDKAAKIAALFYITAVLLSPLPYLMNLLTIAYLIGVLVADSFFVFLSVKLIKDPSPANARNVKNKILLAMLLAMVAFLLPLARW
ncbi:MAG: UbiA family prenyltransferase [Candidatus Baldrarchaeia archaeon]